VEFDPIREGAILVGQRMRVAGHEFADHYLLRCGQGRGLGQEGRKDRSDQRARGARKQDGETTSRTGHGPSVVATIPGCK
jgi:hypothetical protein